MKTLKIITAILAASFSTWGCASSDTSAAMDSTVSAGGTTATERATDNDTPGSQAPMDPDTDMSAEGTTRDVVSADNPMGRRPSIVALAQQTPELSTFLDLIKAADMITILESPATYTVFAPTNEAFGALPAGTVEALKRPDNQLELQRIIQSHVLPNRITTQEMQDNMPMMTAYGEEVIATVRGGTISVGNATIIKPDIKASNGIIHIVNRVLAPPAEQD
ncbi:fasciclin domain-containing protein [Pontibacter litorisediminis]|uniref:fasciclin domain-containing protein n=1 Tax=Pontibacter litorisediminis TaxID=1846260 RepID=UPI0023EAEF1F|nr:fasciclin domain-containing protein [Pontibacter litorisediminis]